MSVHKLVFDATDTDTRAASSNVGAYLRASDGTLITHTGGALDVNIATSDISIDVDLDHTTGDSVQIGDGTDVLAINNDGSLNAVVSATDLDIRDLAQASDSVAVGDGTNLISLTASGEVKIVDNGNSITVDAVQLDVDDLNATDDAVAAWLADGTGNAISSTGGALHISDAGGSLTVDATDFDIRDLSASQDNVAISDGTDTLAINSDGSINVASASYASLKNIAETVGTSAAAIVDGADELANRRELWLYNNGNRTAYVGESGITTSTGFPLPPGAFLEMLAGASMDVYMIADAANQNVRTLQFA